MVLLMALMTTGQYQQIVLSTTDLFCFCVYTVITLYLILLDCYVEKLTCY